MNTEQTGNAVLEVVTTKPSGVDPILKQLALSRFETTFRLEGELVGKGKVKVGKRGQVTLSLRSMSSKDGSGLDLATGLKGDALEACRQKLAQSLKTEFNVLATRLTADKGYEAGKAAIAPNGSVTLEWKPIKDETIIVISEKSAMAALGITPDELAKIQLDRETDKADAAKAKVELAPAAPALVEKPATNGEVLPATQPGGVELE